MDEVKQECACYCEQDNTSDESNKESNSSSDLHSEAHEILQYLTLLVNSLTEACQDLKGSKFDCFISGFLSCNQADQSLLAFRQHEHTLAKYQGYGWDDFNAFAICGLKSPLHVKLLVNSAQAAEFCQGLEGLLSHLTICKLDLRMRAFVQFLISTKIHPQDPLDPTDARIAASDILELRTDCLMDGYTNSTLQKLRSVDSKARPDASRPGRDEPEDTSDSKDRKCGKRRKSTSKEISFDLTSEVLQDKIKKLQPQEETIKQILVQLVKVRVTKFNSYTNRGEMVTSEIEPRLVLFHRNDFKNRAQLLRLMIILKFEFTVMVVDDSQSSPRLLVPPVAFMMGMKDIMQRLHFTRAVVRDINFKDFEDKSD